MTHYTNGTKFVSHTTRKACKIERWIKYTYRLYYNDGSSKYLSMSIAQLEGETNGDTVKYLVNDFKRHIEYNDSLIKVKLISVDGEKVNAIIE